MPFGRRDRAVDRPLELRPVGQPCQVVGARLLGVLARAVKGDGDLVRHRCDKLEIARLESTGQPRGDCHRAQQDTLGPQLRADGAPFTCDAVNSRLGRSGRDLDDSHLAGPARFGELLFLPGLHPDRLGQLEARSFSDPDRPRLQPEHLERLAQPNLGDLGHV